MAKLTVFKCKKCGSMVVKINQGGCSPSCCGEPMKELRANDTDGAKEKHVPDVKVEDGVVKVQVGSVAHPMLDEHYIVFIALETEKGSRTPPGDGFSDTPASGRWGRAQRCAREAPRLSR